MISEKSEENATLDDDFHRTSFVFFSCFQRNFLLEANARDLD